MSKREVKNVKEIPLNNSKNGTIKIGELVNPYGKDSKSVVSIAISLNKGESDWKIHIPFQNLDEVIEALQNMKKQD